MTKLIFSVLGQLEVRHEQLGVIPFANRKAIGLLAYLLIESNRAHNREFLLGLLWPDLPTAAAQNNLRVTWAQLQKALGTSDSDEQPHLTGDRLALRFNPLSHHELDVARFYALIEACRVHPHRDPQACPDCAARLKEAVELVRGELLEEFSLPNCQQFDEWLQTQRHHFHVQMTAALEQLAAFHEGTGQLVEAEKTIRRLLSHDPLNESAYRQLMRILARLDQRSAALEVYETCRRVLAAELGLAPAAETVMLAEQIRALASFESQSTHSTLPPVLTRFLGRQQEFGHLIDLLSRRTVKVVTLAGPGGVGKTRLALEIAHRISGAIANNIHLVELAGVTDANAVHDAVAATLGLPTNTGRSSMNAILDYLRDKTTLLVLDNCEHLVAACAHLVHALCSEAPGLTVLATSRIPLHLDEEHVVRLEPLATPGTNGPERLTAAASLNYDSIRLFADRAAQSLINFTLTDANVQAVARICQQLDGMPLAIEIAAAQVRAMPIEAIADRLGQRFAWLNKRNANTMPRQRTLHTMIDWSYGLLSAQERAVFRQLAVFAGGWTLEAAEAICTAGETCAETLAELVDHSLITFRVDADRQRYSMHETMRQFAEEQLRGSHEEVDALERHARYFAQRVAEAAENLSNQPLPERLQSVKDEHDNLRRAFDWLVAHDRESALAMVAQLGTGLKFWELGGFFQEGRRWLQRALDVDQSSVSLNRAHALLAAAELSSAISDFEYGLQCARTALELFQQLSDLRGEIEAQLTYCELAELSGDNGDLRAQVENLLHMAEQVSYRAGVARAASMLATICIHRGDSETGVQYALRSITLWREFDRPYELAVALNRLASALGSEDYTVAWSAQEECRDIYRSLGYRRGVATATQNLGGFAFDHGDYVLARTLFCESLRIRRELGLRRGFAYSFEFLADVNEAEKRYELAVQLLAAATALRVHLGAPIDQANDMANMEVLARLRAQLGDVVFEMEWAKGTSMSTQQAITLALS